jgi:hypothetical protein
VEPVLGAQPSRQLYEALNQFEQAGSIRKIMGLLDGSARRGN